MNPNSEDVKERPRLSVSLASVRRFNCCIDGDGNCDGDGDEDSEGEFDLIMSVCVCVCVCVCVVPGSYWESLVINHRTGLWLLRYIHTHCIRPH